MRPRTHMQKTAYLRARLRSVSRYSAVMVRVPGFFHSLKCPNCD
jgi:hypothetical protein